MTATKKEAPAAVTTFADHEVITPPNKLKKAVVKLKPGTKVDFDPLANAEAALAELADDFTQWMKSECDRLDNARNEVKAAGFNAGTRDNLFRAAHDIKGQAATFGFPLVAPVAESLCRLIEHTPEMLRIPMSLVDQHVDAVRAITTNNTKLKGMTKGGTTAARLAERLRQVTDEFLLHENRDRPDALEAILAPSIVPGEAP